MRLFNFIKTFSNRLLYVFGVLLISLALYMATQQVADAIGFIGVSMVIFAVVRAINDEG